MRMIMMGTGPFAVPSFEALRAAGHEITLVVTRPQPPVKSRTGPPPSPVRNWAEEHGFVIFDPDSINTDDAVAELRKYSAELLVVCDYGQILKPAALESATLGGINLHGSLLPKYRGAAPVQWAMLSGEAITGVSVIHMTPRLDAGPIVTTRETPIRDDETAGQLEQRLAKIGVEATVEAVSRLAEWNGEDSIGAVQDTSLATKAPRLKKADGEIDWGRSAREIDCHVRGMQPWPVAFTHIAAAAGKPPTRLAIKQVSMVAGSAESHHPGEIVPGDELLVATTDKFIRVDRLQPAGKKEMTGVDFLRGFQVPEGAKLF